MEAEALTREIQTDIFTVLELRPPIVCGKDVEKTIQDWLNL